jgi:hypothetical protein
VSFETSFSVCLTVFWAKKNKHRTIVRGISERAEVFPAVKPYPIPKIQELLPKLKGFQHVISLNLNIGYYHIRLTPHASSICTVTLPWREYEYLRLPMGLCNSPDIFQQKMSKLMEGLEFARAYINNLLIISTGDFSNHLKHLNRVLSRLNARGLKINASKSFFARPPA